MVRRRSTVRLRLGARQGPVHGVSRSGPRRGGVAQLVEQAAHNRCVAGSSPASATRFIALGRERVRSDLHESGD